MIAPPASATRRRPVRPRSSRSRGRSARSAAAAGAAAGRRCPAGCCCGWRPDAIARLGAGLPGGSDDRQRHQRQDDDRRDARRRAARRGPRPGPQPGRLEHGLGRGHGAARAARRARACSRSTRPGCRGSRPSSTRACSCSATCSATSSTATASSSGSPTSGRRWSRRATAGPASSSTPTTRWSPTSAATASCAAATASRYFGIEDPSQALPELQHAFDAKHCRRCGAPYVYERAFVGHLGHYRCPNCGADRPAARRRRDRDRAARHATARGSRSGPRTASSSSSCRCPASTTSTTRSPRSPPRCGLGVRSDAGRAPACERVEAAFGRVETIAVGGSRGLDPADQEPGRRQRGAAHAAARGRGARRRRPRPLDRPQRPDRRRARRLLDLGRRLRAARRLGPARRLHRHARAGDGAAPQVRRRRRPSGSRSSGAIARSLDRALEAAAGRLFALPTYTALLELRTLLAARGLATEFWR